MSKQTRRSPGSVMVALRARSRDRFLAATTFVLAGVVVCIVAVGLWSIVQIDSAARKVEHSTEVLNAYRKVRATVAEQAFAEASYRRAPNAETRTRLEASLELLDDAVEPLATNGDPTDQAAVTHLKAINNRYVANIRKGILDTATPSTEADDRVAGPALDAIYGLTTAAIDTNEAHVTAAIADQRATIRRVVLIGIVVIGAGSALLLACWWLLIRRQHRLAEHASIATRASLQDPLTGLANRRAFDEHLRTVLANNEPTGLILIDLDGFKALNDTLGHTAGDTALTTIAGRYGAATRPDDLVARLGGDEFAIITNAPQHLRQLSDRLLRITTQPIEVDDGLTWTLSASIGATAGTVDDRPDQLIDRADALLYAAKSAGKNTANVDRRLSSGTNALPTAEATRLTTGTSS